MDVTVYGQLRSATGQKEVRIDFEGDTVREALDALVAAYPRAETYLVRGDGELAPSVRVSVNGETVEPDDRCPADASLAVHPAMQGG